jgi:hypothetical protein
MALPDGGEISAGQINNEFGRGWGSYFTIWDARNGSYGGINGCSGKTPGGPGRNTNNGYAWSDWWGHDQSFSCCNIYSYVVENPCDADIRIQTRWHEGTWINETWNWGGYTYHTSARKHTQVNAWFDANIGWGNYWCYCTKRTYSNYRGYFQSCDGYANSGCDLYFTCASYNAEYFEVQFLCY